MSGNKEDKKTNENGTHSNPSPRAPKAPAANPVNCCTILSLLRKVNNTLLRSEGVGLSKVWAPDIHSMQQELQSLKPTETIVHQSLSGKIIKLPINDFYKCIDETMAMAKIKAKRVLV